MQESPFPCLCSRKQSGSWGALYSSQGVSSSLHHLSCAGGFTARSLEMLRLWRCIGRHRVWNAENTIVPLSLLKPSLLCIPWISLFLFFSFSVNSIYWEFSRSQALPSPLGAVSHLILTPVPWSLGSFHFKTQNLRPREFSNVPRLGFCLREHPAANPLTCDLSDAVVSVTLPSPCTPAFQCQPLSPQEFPRVASPCFSPSLLSAAVTLYPLNEVTALLASAFKLHAPVSTPLSFII